jgi:hypothetical protein
MTTPARILHACCTLPVRAPPITPLHACREGTHAPRGVWGSAMKRRRTAPGGSRQIKRRSETMTDIKRTRAVDHCMHVAALRWAVAEARTAEPQWFVGSNAWKRFGLFGEG